MKRCKRYHGRSACIRLSTAVTFVIVGRLSHPAAASLVTWDFAGEVTRVNDVAGILRDSVSVGTPFSGTYTFDSTTADTQPLDPRTGVYPAIVEYSIEMGGLTFLGPLGPNSIIVLLGSPAFPSQGYGTNVGVEWGGFLADTGINLTAGPGEVFVTDELPLVPPPLEAFDLAFLDIGSRDKLFFLEGTVTSLVPEPASLILLLIGAMLSPSAFRRAFRRSLMVPRHLRCVRVSIVLVAVSVATDPTLRSTARAADCNANGTNDECEIDCAFPRCYYESCGSIADCNQNRIPDECEIESSDAIEIVFLMDISSSLGRETPITPVEICDEILDALNDPVLLPLSINAEILALGAPANDDTPCPCCCAGLSGCESNEDLFADKYGTRTCMLTETFGDCAGIGNRNDEDWGNAVAIVAAHKNWTSNGNGPRILVPISDEGPRCGDPINDPGDDRDVVDEAIPIVSCNRVVVSSVVDTGLPDLRALAEQLVLGAVPGGQVLDITDPELGSKLAKMIWKTCARDCNDNGIPDSCDIDDGTSRDCFNGDSNCCKAHGGEGCDDPAVADDVCAAMPSCCDTSWSMACANLAAAAGYCGGGDGIPDECQTDGPDCDADGVPDTCAIACGPVGSACRAFACGAATDCDNDCIPDDCQAFFDCNDNQIRDACDIAGGTSIDCFSGETDCCIARSTPGCDDPAIEDIVCDPGFLPSCCDTAWTIECVDLADIIGGDMCVAPDGVPDECRGEGTDCNGNGIPDSCDLNCGPAGTVCAGVPGCGTADDCNNNCTLDECDVSGEQSPDCNANGVPDECELLSNDCNENGVPDECEDCNGNGLADECDLANGTSCDADGNGVLDECFACCIDDLLCRTVSASVCAQLGGQFFEPALCAADAGRTDLPCQCSLRSCCDGATCSDNILDCECAATGRRPTGGPCSQGTPCDPGACCSVSLTCDNANAGSCGGTAVYIGGAVCNDPGVCVSCPDWPVDPAEHEPCGTCKNRFISFAPGNACRTTAIRVTLEALYADENADPAFGCPPRAPGCSPEGKCNLSGHIPCSEDDDCPADLSGFAGEVRWVGPPAAMPENSSPAFPGFVAAALQCQPHFRDWSPDGLAVDLPAGICAMEPVTPCASDADCGVPGGCVPLDMNVLHVFGAEVLPCSTYQIQIVRHECADQLTDDTVYSEVLELRTGKWGDLWRPFTHDGSSGAGQPNVVDLT